MPPREVVEQGFEPLDLAPASVLVNTMLCYQYNTAYGRRFGKIRKA